jgi:membrane protein
MHNPSTMQNLGGRPRAAVTKPHVGHWSVRFVKLLFNELLHDNLVDNGAMMAYYAIVALFPMLVFVVTMGLLVLPESTLEQGVGMATQAMPPASRQLVTDQVIALMKSAHAGFAIGGAVLALWGASRGINSLMGALNAMFNTVETRPWWKRQVIALSMTLSMTGVVIAALGLLVVGPLVGHWIVDRFGLGGVFDWLWAIGHWVGAGLLVLFVWSALYKFLPNTGKPFRMFSIGAVSGVLIWLVISFGFGFYLSHFNSYSNTYGALGGGIIFLTWLWLSAIALLFGAEINDVIDHMRSGAPITHADDDAPANGIG